MISDRQVTVAHTGGRRALGQLAIFSGKTLVASNSDESFQHRHTDTVTQRAIVYAAKPARRLRDPWNPRLCTSRLVADLVGSSDENGTFARAVPPQPQAEITTCPQERPDAAARLR
jgi:hypothetical protein